MTTDPARATGVVNSITRDDDVFIVDVEITTESIGSINIAIEVPGPFSEAIAQARQRLFQLGSELFHGFEHKSDLQ